MSEPKTPASQETKPFREIDEQTQKHIDRFLQGPEAWNKWANEMLARKVELEKVGKWKVQQCPDSSLRYRTMSANPSNPELQAWLDEAYVDFSKLIFQTEQRTDLQKGEEEKKASFNSISVDGTEINFSDFLFPGDTEFEAAEFSGGHTYFDRAKFEGGRTSYTKTKFTGGGGSFRDVAFSGGDVSFIGTEFSGGYAIFEAVEFSGGDAVFFETEFTGGKVNFINTKFSGGIANFAKAKFGDEVDFRCANFESEVHFREVQFGSKASFTKANFGDEVDFRFAKFESEVHFRKVQFSRNVNFTKVYFKDQVYFLESQFKGETNFWLAQFDGEVDFRRTKFEEVAVFREVDFKRHVDFALAKFESTVDFEAILVKRAFSLAGVKFNSNIPNFTQANFSESPRLDNVKVLPAPKLKKSPFGWQRYFWTKNYLSYLMRLLNRYLFQYSKYIWNKFTNTRRNPNEEAHYRALKRLAIQAHDHENEMKFFAGEIRARRHITDFANFLTHDFASSMRYWAGVAYELFSDFGRSFIRPALWWFACLWLFANLTLSGAELKDNTKCHNSQLTPIEAAYTIGLKNSLLILGLTKTNIVKQAELCLYGTNKNGKAVSKLKPYNPKIKRNYKDKQRLAETTKTDIPFKAAVQGIIHSGLSLLFIFLLLLAIRNQFKIK